MLLKHPSVFRSVFVFTLFLAAFTACQSRLPQELRGVTLPDPKPKPAVVLTDTEGRPFDFRKETEGKLTLLFFGYTYCPDICPVHMANIAAVLKESTYEVKSKTRVIFVTVDPKRDTPQRLRTWLNKFHTEFVGLHGDDAVVAQFQRELNIPEGVTSPTSPDDEEYTVGHAAQIIAFTPDGLGRYAYPFGTRQEDWGHDLPLLVSGRRSSRSKSEPEIAVEEGQKERAAISVPVALIPSPAEGGPGVLYAVIKNNTTREDALIGVTTPLAGRAELHTMAQEGGRMMMQAVTAVTLPSKGSLRLAPGGVHAMLFSLTGPTVPGGRVPVTFTFRSAGPVTTAAQVVRYEQIESLLKKAE